MLLLLLIVLGVVVDGVSDTKAVLSATSNQLQLGTTNTMTITAPAPSTSRTISIPDPGATGAAFLLSKGDVAIAGDFQQSKTTPELGISNAASSGSSAQLWMQGASGAGFYSAYHADGGEVQHKNDNAAAFLWYTKTSGGSLKVDMRLNNNAGGGTGLQLWETTDSDGIVIAPANTAATRTYTLPEVGAGADFVMSEGAQTLNGLKTFGTGLKVPTTATGASATQFDYYEEYAHSTNCYGPWGGIADPRSCPLRLVRIGSGVAVYTTSRVMAPFSSDSPILFSTAVPSRFRPAHDLYCYYSAHIQGQKTPQLAKPVCAAVDTDGYIGLYSDAGHSDFYNIDTGTFVGWNTSSLLASYLVG
jgi:hypothetical protein